MQNNTQTTETTNIKKRKENKLTKHICVVCGKEFEARQGDAKFCSYECSKQYHDQQALEKKTKELLENGVENVDYIIDRWNGLPTVRLYGRWFQKMHPGRTMEEYKTEFPDAPITIPKDKTATSKNSGKFMRKPEYREKYSKMMSGENNPNHHINASKQKRKENSPFSKEFYKRKNLTENDRKVFLKSVSENRSYNTQIEYYINKGYDIETSRKMLAERQRTNAIDKIIKKYGAQEGQSIYKKRQEKWLNSIYKNDNSLIKKGRSHFADDIIDSIMDKIQSDHKNDYMYKTNEFKLHENGYGKLLRFDLTNTKEQRIIEFNGDYWHCNPQLYESDYYNKSIGMQAKDKWREDERKIAAAKSAGYDVLVVWESEYVKNPEYTVEKCVRFLTGEK